MSKSLDDLAADFADKAAFRVPYDGSNKFYDDNHYKWAVEAFKAGYKQRNDELAEWTQKMRESNCVSTPQEVLKMLAEAFHQKSFEDFDTREQSIALWMASKI